MTGDKKQNDRDGSKKSATTPPTTTTTTATATSAPNRTTTNKTFLADNADPTIRNKPGSGVA